MDRFTLNEDEKKRILNLHESATKRQYLPEQVNTTHDKSYDYKKDGDKYYYRKKGEKTFKKAPTGGDSEESIKVKVFKEKPSNSKSSNSKSSNSKSTPLPFKSKAQGDKFRGWMNRFYPNTSKSIDLDKTGPFNNPTIKKAWNKSVNNDVSKKFGVSTFGDLYNKQNPNWNKKTEKEKSSNSKSTPLPFKSKAQGDKFRGWMNRFYPNTSKSIDLDKTGEFNNPTIKKAWNKSVNNDVSKKFGVSTFGDLYKKQYPNWNKKTEKEKIETGTYKISNTIPNADRVNKELYYINARPEYNDKPFVIVDPRLNLVLAFDSKHKLIDYSQTVAGADKQKDVLFTRKMWCESSHKDNSYINFKGSDMCVRTVNGKVHTSYKPFADADEKVGYLDMIYRYDMLKDLKARYAQKGIYGIEYNHFEPGYQGTSGTPNLYGLKKDGISVGTAIHALVPVEGRIIADTELKKLLQKDLNSGTIPKNYIDMVEKDFLSSSKEKKFDKSSGCFNVDPKFIQNSKVQKVFNYPGVPVFIMGEQDTNYLVQVEPGKEGKFMLDLGGKDGRCTSPTGLSNTYGTQVGLA